MSLKDLDFNKLPEPKAKKFFRKAFDVTKSGIGFAKKLHERKVALEKAQAFHEAQRRAKDFKDWKYIQGLETHREKMKAFPELGLTLGDFIWKDKEKRTIDAEKAREKVNK